jgi:type I restriction enzyme S subunit
VEVQVGDVAASLIDGPFGSNLKTEHYTPEGVRVIRLQNIGDGRFEDTDKAFISEDRYQMLRRHDAQPADVLIAAMGDILPRVCMVPPQLGTAIVKADCFRLRPNGLVDGKYLAFALQSPQMRAAAAPQIAGVGRPRLNLRKVRNLPIALAPLAEQRRIVAAIEEAFLRIDVGVAGLERARRKLGRMRTAALQAAVLDALECTGGEMTPLADLLSAPLANGKSVPDGPETGFPVLRLSAVRDGWIDIAYAKKGAWTAEEAARYVIREGDYLVVRGNGSKHLVGRGGMVGSDAEVAYPDTLIRLRFAEARIVPRYAALIWDSRTVRDQIEGAARTTAGIYKINQKDLAGITVPVPSVEDQVRIQATADDFLYLIAFMERRLDTQLRRSNALRASILSTAFSGELVPQDPNDGPVAVVPGRIAYEEASSGRHRQLTGNRQTQSAHQKVTA